MREIKFRAWGDEGMTDDFYVNHLGQASVWNPETGQLEDQSHWVLMQYTGLKDKNGKEIYEGDIVKVNDEWDEGTICEIVYLAEKWKYPAFDLEPQMEENGLQHYTVEGEIEVIGNIYENPELIKGARRGV